MSYLPSCNSLVCSYCHQSPRGTRRDLDSLFAEEISSWERERLSTQNALRQAEREIIRLKLELEQNAANRESDVELLLSNGDIPEHQQQKVVTVHSSC